VIRPLTAFRASDTDLKRVDKLVNLGEFKGRSDFFRRATSKMLETYQDKLGQNIFFTVGYEGRDIDEFMSLLKENNIRRLVDVREIPASRKTGFSKNRLAESVMGVNMEYIHIPELGSPKELRDQYRENKDVDWFMITYKSYLEKLNGPFTRVTQLVEQEGTCLMCYEKDFTLCHRSVIAEKLKVGGHTPIHL
jgi:uncharacterized protein (DUF488 family)